MVCASGFALAMHSQLRLLWPHGRVQYKRAYMYVCIHLLVCSVRLASATRTHTHTHTHTHTQSKHHQHKTSLVSSSFSLSPELNSQKSSLSLFPFVSRKKNNNNDNNNNNKESQRRENGRPVGRHTRPRGNKHSHAIRIDK